MSILLLHRCLPSPRRQQPSKPSSGSAPLPHEPGTLVVYDDSLLLRESNLGQLPELLSFASNTSNTTHMWRKNIKASNTRTEGCIPNIIQKTPLKISLENPERNKENTC
ncbi:hypothetical protein V6N11_031830 [Hibiscus sabdariffa]|uniref:Uncharacterized protein n=1 Tax=Hibiscus sabdariffa TaxID=183260 RepID=A0ABR2SYU6_9ROSI